MIVHRYSQYDGNDNPFDPHELMARVGDLIMRYQIGMDEALKIMLNSGEIPNMFLKEAGLTDLVQNIIEDLEDLKKGILKKYSLEKSRIETEQLSLELESKLKEEIKRSNVYPLDQLSIDDNPDLLYKIKWSVLNKELQPNKLHSLIDQSIENNEILQKINKAQKSFEFKGSKSVPKESINNLLTNLFHLEDTIQALKEAIAHGDFNNLDLKKLEDAIGHEKFIEFMELQNSIVEKVKSILDQQQLIEKNDQSEEYQISPKAIEYISSKALSEFYGDLHHDNSGSTLSDESGDGSQTIGGTKPYQFGDNVYHIDWTSTITNTFLQKRDRPTPQDIEVYRSRGMANNAIVVMLDMSGSMYRFGRFYHAKKMILAFDRLMKKEYPNDRLEIVGFGSLAEQLSIHDMVTLQPYPVIYTDPLIRLQLNLEKFTEKNKRKFPLYFTNLQRGLNLSRRLLSGKESSNKQIVLITDGVPTAHIKGSTLYLNYPPTREDFNAALREVHLCREDDIIINTFLLSGEWWENTLLEETGTAFASRFVKASGGRFFQPHPYELGTMVLYDYIHSTKKKIVYGS